MRKRPAIPPVTWCAAAAWSGVGAAEALYWTGGTRAGVAALVLVIGAGAGAARGRRVLLALVAVSLAVGGVTAWLQLSGWQQVSSVLASAGARDWCGTVVSDAREQQFGTRVTVRLASDPGHGALVSLAWPDDEVPELGESVCFSAIMRGEEDPLRARGLARAGIAATARPWIATTAGWRPGPVGALRRWRADATRSLGSVFPDEAGAVMRAIAFGDRRALVGSTAEGDFRVAGISHIVAVSGLHLGLVCAAVTALGGALRLPAGLRYVVTLVAGAAFVQLVGAPYSASRAFAMVCVGGAASLVGVRRDSIGALAVAALSIVVVDPRAAFSLGFRLSVAAVGSLLLFGGLATTWAESAAPRWARGAVGAASIAVVAQVATVPLAGSAFGLLSMVAPIANAIALPLVPAALGCTLVGAIVSPWAPSLGRTALGLGWLATRGVLQSARTLSTLPLAAIPVGVGATPAWALIAVCGVALWVRWPTPKTPQSARTVVAVLIGVCLVACVGPPGPSGAEVHFLDVGQGDAVLVRSGARTLLVDGGTDPAVLRAALGRHGIRAIDMVVMTHDHADHVGGLERLEEVCTVGWVGTSALDDGDAIARDLGLCSSAVALGRGDEWAVGETSVSVLWPARDAEVDEENSRSVVLRVRTQLGDIVLTGDAEADVESQLVALGDTGTCIVLKVPHHGSNEAVSELVLERWRPRIAVISVGADNGFGHPAAETVRLLQTYGAQVLRTDVSGDIRLRVTSRGVSIRTQRRGTAVIACARMKAPTAALASIRSGTTEECHGRQRPGRTQARVSHLRQRGASPGARAPPASRPRGRGCRSGLQLPRLRWGER